MSSNLRRLEYFLAVARELNFTRAAENLHVAQSALSRQIRLLEHDLGTALLTRNTHAVALTPAGELLSESGPRLLRAIDDLWAEVRRAGRAETVSISLAYTTSSGYETAPRLVEAVRSLRVDLQVTTQLMDGAAMTSAVRSGTVDIGLARHLDYTEGLERHVVRREREGVLMLADDALVSEPVLEVAQLTHRTILLHSREANPAHFDHVVELCRNAGFEPTLLSRAVAFDPANTPISDGKAVAIVGESVCSSLAESMVWRPLSDPGAQFDVHLVVNPTRRRAAIAEFVTAARAYAHSVGWL